MKLSRLRNTTAFRLSLLLTLAFSLFSAGSLYYVYWTTDDHVTTQIDNRLRLESDVLIKLYRTRALPALLTTLQQRNVEDRGGSNLYLLSGPDNSQLFGPASRWEWPASTEPRFFSLRLDDLVELPGDAGAKRPMRVIVSNLTNGYTLLIAHDISTEKELLRHISSAAVVATGLILLFALCIGVFFGYNVLRRIDVISSTAGNIIDGDLSQRLVVHSRQDEFDELSSKLNLMLGRIEQLMDGMRQVTDNIAHDLRSPLNRLRNRLEVTLLDGRDTEEYRSVMQSAIGDAEELIATFNALLNIARVESGIDEIDWSEVALDEVANDLAELYEAAAEEQLLQFTWQCDEGCRVWGNKRLIAQAISNLLDNAIKYTPLNGCVSLSVLKKGSTIQLCVTDTGPGIPAADRDRVLERMVRLEGARSSAGNGLGLSLVKAIAGAHKAKLILGDNEPGLKVCLDFTALGASKVSKLLSERS
ncbi:MAG TPA: two-component sensor histidine kinase [Gammaproteobacteria bacterium]|nr:two-component sensor histidine kinase [Gammaproteobacteria bacterium]